MSEIRNGQPRDPSAEASDEFLEDLTGGCKVNSGGDCKNTRGCMAGCSFSTIIRSDDNESSDGDSEEY